MEALVDILLLGFLVIIALTILKLRNLFAVVMLLGIFSFLMAGFFVILDAVDVAFTEASVGAGISTVLMLGTLALTDNREKAPNRKPILPLLVVLATGAALVYATFDMPRVGDADNPIHKHVAPRYIEDSPTEIGVPNMVTSVLASYRGYDTLGETTVIFTAGVGVMLMLGGLVGRRRRRGNASGEERGE